MKKYKVHLTNARHALNSGNVDAYKRGISALIRSATSNQSRNYLVRELRFDGFHTNLYGPFTADSIHKV